jgi:hypothetical protein
MHTVCALSVNTHDRGDLFETFHLVLTRNKTVIMKLELIIMEAANACRFWDYISLLCVGQPFLYPFLQINDRTVPRDL